MHDYTEERKGNPPLFRSTEQKEIAMEYQDVGSYKYECGGNPPTVFHLWKNTVSLSRLFGLPLCHGEMQPNPFHARGLAMVDTSLGRFEDGGLELASHRFEETQVTLVWTAAGGKLELTSRWEYCEDTGVWTRSDSLLNRSGEEVVVYSCIARFPFVPGRYEYYSQSSKWNNENQGIWRNLEHGTMLLSCQGGQSCKGGTPFAILRQKTEGAPSVAFHVVPAGNWMIRIRSVENRCEEPLAILEAGLSDQNLRMRLAQGQAVKLPDILFHALPYGREHSGTAGFHSHILNYVFNCDKPAAPVVYNTWFLDFDNLKVPVLREQLRAAKEIGCEVFVVDAGWFGTGNGWWEEVGYWQEKRHASFFGDMAGFAGEVRAQGLGFGLWMEPERIGPLAPILQEHPDWFRSAGNGFHYIDLTNSEAYKAFHQEICRLIDTYGLVWMKIDFNFSFGIDRSGDEFHSYYSHWYAMLDSLRAQYPQMFFEACSSGGLRSDLNTMSHTHCHFLSDTVNPLDVIRISEGAALRLPPGWLSKWVVLRNGGKGARHYNDAFDTNPEQLLVCGDAQWDTVFSTTVNFAMKACMVGVMGISSDIAGLSDLQRLEMARILRYYKQWRQFIRSATAALLTPPVPRADRSGWSAMQLCNQEKTESLVFVYRLEDYLDTHIFYPLGLAGEALYTIASPDDKSLSGTRSGRQWMQEGFAVKIPSCFEAAVVEFRAAAVAAL